MEIPVVVKVRSNADPSVSEGLKQAEGAVRSLKGELAAAERGLKQVEDAVMSGSAGFDALAAAQTRVTSTAAQMTAAQEHLGHSVIAANAAAQQSGKSFNQMAQEAKAAARATEEAAAAQAKLAGAQESGGMGSKTFLLRSLGRGAGLEGLGPGGAMLGRAAGVLGGLEGFSSGPIIAAFAAIAGGALLAENALKSYENQQTAIGKGLEEQSRQLQATAKGWHDLQRSLVDTGGALDTVASKQARTDAMAGKKLEQVARETPTEGIYSMMDREHSTPDSYRAQAAAQKDAAKKAGDQEQALRQIRQIFNSAGSQQANWDPNSPQRQVQDANLIKLMDKIPGFAGKFGLEPQRLPGATTVFGDLTAQEQHNAILQSFYKKAGSTGDPDSDFNGQLSSAIKDASYSKGSLLDQASGSAAVARKGQGLAKYDRFNFDADALNKQLGTVSGNETGDLQSKQALIEQAIATSGLAGMPGLAQQQSMRNDLANPDISPQTRAVYEKILALASTSKRNKEALTGAQINDIKGQSQDAKDAGLFDPDTDTSMRVHYGRQKESDYTQRALDLAESNGSTSQQTALKKELRGEKLSEGTKGLEDAIRPAQKAYEELKATGTATSAQLVAANANIKTSIDGWASANGPLIAQLPELKKLVGETYEASKIQGAEAAAKRFGENELKLHEQIASIQDAAVTKLDQARAVEQSIALVIEQQHAGLIKQDAAKRDLLALGKQQAAIERAAALELEKQVHANQDLGAAMGKEKLGELKTERDRGEVTGSGMDYDIKNLEEAEFQHKFDLVQRGYEEELKANHNSVEAAKHASMERQRIIDEETLKEREALRKRSDDFAKDQDKRANGVHGSALNISALPEFGDNFGRMIDDGLTGGGSTDMLPGLTGQASRIQQNYAKTPLASNLQRVADDDARRNGALGGRAGAAMGGGQDNVHVTVEVVPSPLFQTSVSQTINDKARADAAQQRLLFGNAPPQQMIPG